MKKLIYFFLSATLLSGVLTGCDYETIDTSVPSRPWNVVIQGIEDNEIVASRDGRYVRVRIDASGQWSTSVEYTAEGDDGWVILSATSGHGSADLLLMVDLNAAPKTRYATVNFIGADTRTFTILQSSATVMLEVTPSSMDIESDAQIQYASVIATSNYTWQISVVDKTTQLPVTWITPSKSSGVGNAVEEGRVVLNITQNNDGVVREAWVLFQSETALEMPDGSSMYLRDTIEISQLYYIPPMDFTLTNGNDLYATWVAPTGTPFPIEKFTVDFFTPGEIVVIKTIEFAPDKDTIMLATLSGGPRDVVDNGPNDIMSLDIRVSALGTDSEGQEVALGRSARLSYNTHFASTTNGTNAENAYQVANLRHLQNVNVNLNGFYKLMENIDLTGVNWTPIAGKGGTGPSSTRPEFTGTFDGNSKTISNLTITHTGGTSISDRQNMTTLGLFGKVCGATVKDLTVSNVNINATSFDDEVHTGGLIGYIEFKANTGAGRGRGSTVSNCHVVGGSITVRATLGAMDGNNANVRVAANSATGGVVGLMDVHNVATGGAAAGTSTTEAPAANSGPTTATRIENCGNTANIDGAFTAGGVLGAIGYTRANSQYNVFCTVSRCYNKGSVTINGLAQTTNGAAGILGKALLWTSQYLTGHFINESWNTGTIDGKAIASVGGIAGRLIAYGAENCYNRGDLIFNSTTANVVCGGIAGFVSSTVTYNFRIQNNYNTGTISGTGTAASKGRVVGSLQQAIVVVRDNGALTQTGIDIVGTPIAGANVAGSFDLQSADLSDRNKFPATWDFTGIWVAGANGPTLRNNPER